MDREISCRSLRNITLYIESLGRDPAEIYEGLPYSESHLNDPNEWISNECWHEIQDRVERMFGRDDIFYDIGLATNRLRAFGIVDRIARLIASPELVVRQLPRISASFARTVSVKLRECHSSRAVIEWQSLPGYPPNRHDCYFRRGCLRVLPEVQGLGMARIAEEQCSVPVDQVGWRNGKRYRVDDRNRVFEVKAGHGGGESEIEIGVLEPDGAFEVDGLRYGAPSCVYQLWWRRSRPLLHRLVESLLGKSKLVAETMAELEALERDIELKYVEVEATNEELRRAGEKYERLVRSSKEVVYQMDRNGHLTFVNATGAQIYGYDTPEEMIGIRASGMLADPSESKEFILELRKHGFLRNHQLRVRRKNGELFYIEVTCNWMRDEKGQIIGHEGIHRDVTERVRLENEIKESEEKYRNLMMHANDGILLVDPYGKVVEVNARLTEMAGYRPEELQRMNAVELCAPEYRQKAETIFRRVLRTGSHRDDSIPLLRKDGSHLAVDVGASVVTYRGKQLIQNIFRDISERKRLETMLRKKNVELREQNEKIRQADRLKSEFLANVSHELSTPLTCIKGFSKMLLGQETDDARREEFTQIIHAESDRMAQLIRSLLELSKIEAGIEILDCSDVNLNDIVRRVLLLLKPRVDERHLELDSNLDPRVQASRLDPDKIQQMALNLLDNAIKFSPNGGRLTVATVDGDGETTLRIGNTGNKLTGEERRRMFERFTQLDGSYSRKHGGLGLGLYLVRAIVRLHGGSVGVSNEPNGEIVFSVTLPHRENAST